MIEFSQFLAEARSAPLFHGTKVGHLHSILDHGLKPITTHPADKLLKPLGRGTAIRQDGTKASNHYTGVSFTRSRKFANDWSDSAITLVLEYDQLALSQKYEIVPLQFWRGKARVQGPTNEFEEFIMTTKPIPSNFIKRIYYAENSNWSEEERKRGMYVIENAKMRFPKIKFVEFKH